MTIFRTVSEGYELGEPTDIGNGVTIELERSGGVLTGLFWGHACTTPGKGCIAFDTPGNEHVPGTDKWQIETLDPLTLSPSLLCRLCGRHGFIRQGRWVEAG